MAQYVVAVHAVAPCSHLPSLELTYASFWAAVDAGFEPPPSEQVIVLAAMFSSVVSMDEHTVISELGGFPKSNWVRLASSTAPYLEDIRPEEGTADPQCRPLPT